MIRRHSRPIVCYNRAVMSWSFCHHFSSPWLLSDHSPIALWNFHAVLAGVNALRSASTVRSARPAGIDTACAPLEAGKYAMVEVRIAVDSTRSEAYVRNIHVPHGTPSTSSDVERFGMTPESLVPTAT